MSTLLKITFILLLMGSTEVLPKVIYVKAGNPTPVAPYLTQETASDSIRYALSVAREYDTILVLPGTYKEYIIYPVKNLSIIGTDRASCVLLLNFPCPYPPYVSYIVLKDNCVFKKFTISSGGATLDCGIFESSDSARITFAENVKIDSVTFIAGNFLVLFHIISGYVSNIDVVYCEIFFLPDDRYPLNSPQRKFVVFDNITVKDTRQIVKFYSTRGVGVLFKRGKFRSKKNLQPVTYLDATSVSAAFENCTFVWGPPFYQSDSYYTNIGFPLTLKFTNCTLSGRVYSLFEYYAGTLELTNCIIYGPNTVIQRHNEGNTKFKYNFFSNSAKAYFIDSTNINGCNTPVYCDLYNNNYVIEERLDRFSDAIDKGDPAILDADGSRSDIGALGGPGGRDYKYPDLAPASPDTVYYWSDRTNWYIAWFRPCAPDVKRYWVYGSDEVTLTDCKYLNHSLGITTDTFLAVPKSRFPAAPPPNVVVVIEDTAGNKTPCKNTILRTPVLISTIEPIKDELKSGSISVYPNPVSGLLTLNYTIGEYARVTLKVFSTTGEDTAEVLCNEERQSGTYTQQVQLKGASGIYIVRLTVVNAKGEKKEFTEKVSLVK